MSCLNIIYILEKEKLEPAQAQPPCGNTVIKYANLVVVVRETKANRNSVYLALIGGKGPKNSLLTGSIGLVKIGAGADCTELL